MVFGRGRLDKIKQAGKAGEGIMMGGERPAYRNGEIGGAENNL